MSMATLEFIHGLVVLAVVAAGSILIAAAVDRVVFVLERRRIARKLDQYRRASAELISKLPKK
jgi:uncharacterized membrane protein YdfJ with MMPL/SSD domain